MINKKVLVLYGIRGWNKDNDGYCISSIQRGYAGLNAYVHKIETGNPKITIQSISHNVVTLPEYCLCSVTIVYSGEINNKSAFTGIPHPDRTHKDKNNLEDCELGYGTVYEVYL